MKVVTPKTLNKDKLYLEEAIWAKELEITEIQATILRMDGALVYISKQLEHIEGKEYREKVAV